MKKIIMRTIVGITLTSSLIANDCFKNLNILEGADSLNVLIDLQASYTNSDFDKIKKYKEMNAVINIPKGNKICIIEQYFDSYKAKILYNNNFYWIEIFPDFRTDTNKFIKLDN